MNANSRPDVKTKPRDLLRKIKSFQFLTSGAKYSGVPQNVFVVDPKRISSLQRPKSVILM